MSCDVQRFCNLNTDQSVADRPSRGVFGVANSLRISPRIGLGSHGSTGVWPVVSLRELDELRTSETSIRTPAVLLSFVEQVLTTSEAVRVLPWDRLGGLYCADTVCLALETSL